jgi:hypothetical protein
MLSDVAPEAKKRPRERGLSIGRAPCRPTWSLQALRGLQIDSGCPSGSLVGLQLVDDLLALAEPAQA